MIRSPNRARRRWRYCGSSVIRPSRRAGLTGSAGSSFPIRTITTRSASSGWPFTAAIGRFATLPCPTICSRCLRTAKLCYHSAELDLYELPDVSPMAFDRAAPQRPLPIRFHGWGGEVQTPGKGVRTVVVNVAARPWLRAASGGQSLASSADDWNRLEVRVPDGVSRFDFFYDLPWRRGIFFGAVLAAATLAGFALIRKHLSTVP